MKNLFLASLGILIVSAFSAAQRLTLHQQVFELKNVTGSVIEFQGEKVLKIERDLNAIPFDEKRLESTVDEPTFAKLTDLDFEDGTIEIKMYSQLQNPVPNNYQGAQGFIGVFFRVAENDRAFESIYLRPRVGRSDNQFYRNHAVQYFAYPDFKFETLRKKAAGRYEGSAPVALNEWITMRLEIRGRRAEMFINDARYSSFVVDSLLGGTQRGAIGLYVDIGTIGYFKDLKVTRVPNRAREMAKEWERSKAYTQAYLQAMPENGYALKPTKEMRSFAEQMMHLAATNEAFAADLSTSASPGTPPSTPKPASTKAEVLTQVLASYDTVIHHIQSLTAVELNASVKLFGQFILSNEQAWQKGFEHQAHHRGQPTVYLRMAGITPPAEQLF
jgi:uncharacterized damage-inducible protein DinB